MNIPGDELYALLHAALKKRGQETLQRALYLAFGRPFWAEGFGPAASCPVRERWRSRSRFP